MHDLEGTSTTLPNRFNAIESIGDVVVSVELLCLEILSATWRGQKNGGKFRESLGKLRNPPLLSLLMQVLNSLSKEIVGRGNKYTRASTRYWMRGIIKHASQVVLLPDSLGGSRPKC